MQPLHDTRCPEYFSLIFVRQNKERCVCWNARIARKSSDDENPSDLSRTESYPWLIAIRRVYIGWLYCSSHLCLRMLIKLVRSYTRTRVCRRRSPLQKQWRYDGLTLAHLYTLLCQFCVMQVRRVMKSRSKYATTQVRTRNWFNAARSHA